MKRIITESIAQKGMIVILISVIIFHFLVIMKVVPETLVWGGKGFQSQKKMLMLETAAIVLNLLILIIVLAQAQILRTPLSTPTVRRMMWSIGAFFLLNTLGNLFSTSETEKIIFLPLTLILSVLSVRLALSPMDK